MTSSSENKFKVGQTVIAVEEAHGLVVGEKYTISALVGRKAVRVKERGSAWYEARRFAPIALRRWDLQPGDDVYFVDSVLRWDLPFGARLTVDYIKDGKVRLEGGALVGKHTLLPAVGNPHIFSPGDKIVCVANSVPGGLKFGEEYTVEHRIMDFTLGTPMVSLEGCANSRYAENLFVLASKHKEQQAAEANVVHYTVIVLATDKRRKGAPIMSETVAAQEGASFESVFQTALALAAERKDRE